MFVGWSDNHIELLCKKTERLVSKGFDYCFRGVSGVTLNFGGQLKTKLLFLLSLRIVIAVLTMTTAFPPSEFFLKFSLFSSPEWEVNKTFETESARSSASS